MYQGQIAVISNKADWTGPFTQLVDEADSSIINILNPDIAFDCVVTIRGRSNHHDGYGDTCGHVLVTASISNGKVIASAGDDGPGFQWSLTVADLSCLRFGTYHFGIKTTTNDEVNDLVDGTLAVIEGN